MEQCIKYDHLKEAIKYVCKCSVEQQHHFYHQICRKDVRMVSFVLEKIKSEKDVPFLQELRDSVADAEAIIEIERKISFFSQ